MLESLDWKIIAALLSTACGILGFVPLFIGMFKGEAKPHLYTWLIWTLTFGIANASVWTGGGGLVVSIGMAINLFLCAVTVLFCFRYGTKNITRSDTIALFGALFAIFVWVWLDSPILALLLATGIDLIGYWPTYRKSYEEPWTESTSSWLIYTAAPIFTLLALQEYNVLTATYSSTTFIANVALLLLLVLRRRNIPKPTN